MLGIMSVVMNVSMIGYEDLCCASPHLPLGH